MIVVHLSTATALGTVGKSQDIKSLTPHYGLRSEHDFLVDMNEWPAKMADTRREPSKEMKERDGFQCRQIDQETPCPYYGIW